VGKYRVVVRLRDWSAVLFAAMLVGCGGPRGTKPVAPVTVSTSYPTNAELLFWDSIKSDTNPAAFEEYLRRYPQGHFAGLVQLRTGSTARASRRRATAQE
jgi:hypothetical protein